MNWHNVIGLAFALCGNALMSGQDVSGGELMMRLEDIVTGLRDRYVDVHNLTIKAVLEEEIVAGVPPRDLEKLKRDSPYKQVLGDTKLGFPFVEFEARIDGERRYSKVKTPPFGKYEVSRKTYKGFADQVERSWNGTVGMTLEPEVGYIVANRQNPVLSNYVLWYLDRAVSDVDLNDSGHTYLPQSLDVEKARLLSKLEDVEDCSCHVVEVPGRDRLFVDVSKNFALVKREIRYPDETLRQVTVATDWKEVHAGLWLPERIERKWHCPPDRGKSKANTVATQVVITAQYDDSQLEDTSFVIEFPSGTFVADETRGVTYTVPLPGEEAIERSIDTIRPKIAKRDRNWALVLAIVGALLLVLLWFVFKAFPRQ